tara:strand:- start:368 stop:607 length:240 start_codon:yes stop_codon:yes gene_type:complete
MTIKCPECNSTKLEYYPDVDNMSWVRHIYVQDKDEWKIKVFTDEDKDVGTIKDWKIYEEDSMPYMYCQDCTAEIDGRYL